MRLPRGLSRKPHYGTLIQLLAYLDRLLSTQAGHNCAIEASPKAAVQFSEDPYCRALAAPNASLWVPASDKPSGRAAQGRRGLLLPRAVSVRFESGGVAGSAGL